MTRSFLVFSLSLTTCSAVLAQDSTSVWRFRKNAVGIEVTALIPFRESSNPFYLQYPYILTYRRLAGPGWIRFGIGGSNNSSATEGTNNAQVSSGEQSTWSYTARLGYAVPLLENDRWLVLAALDGIQGSQGSRYKQTYSDGDVLTDATILSEFGAGLGLDAQWRLSKRLSLGTEFNAIATWSRSERKRELLLSPEYNDEFTTTGSSFQAIRAFSLFLITYF